MWRAIVTSKNKRYRKTENNQYLTCSNRNTSYVLKITEILMASQFHCCLKRYYQVNILFPRHTQWTIKLKILFICQDQCADLVHKIKIIAHFLWTVLAFTLQTMYFALDHIRNIFMFHTVLKPQRSESSLR